MVDFTLSFYSSLLDIIKNNFPEKVIRFDQYFLKEDKPIRFCILRHDVDRDLRAALEMARIENSKNLKATYYFRRLRKKADESIVKSIKQLGHEIGYHYESLAEHKGDKKKALEDFKNNLVFFNNISKISTISMHGSPMSFYNNIDLWKDIDKQHFFKKFGLLGEIYMDIDYSDIAYITDTGRKWNSQNSNLRDRVKSNVIVKLKNGLDLLDYLNNKQNDKIILQIHPERWTDNQIKWFFILIKDFLSNQIKKVLRVINEIPG